MTYRSDSKLREIIMALASRPGGMCTAEMTGYTVDQASAACNDMGKRGLIFRVKLGHRSLRWFADEAAAKAYEASHQPKAAAVNTAAATQHGRVRWAPDAEVKITSETRITVGQSYTGGPAWAPPKMQPVRQGSVDFLQIKSRGF